jgi:hypothetical protein
MIYVYTSTYSYTYIHTQDAATQEENETEDKVQRLQAAEARIKARVGKLLGSYSDAASEGDRR